MQKYNVGQMLTLKEDMSVRTEITNREKVIKKGTKSWIMANPNVPAMFLQDGSILSLDKNKTEIVGIDTEGLTEFIYLRLLNHTYLREMMEEYDESAEHIKEIISEALDDIGFQEGDTED